MMRISGSLGALWKRAILRGTAFSGEYRKLRRLYSLVDPWDMASAREQHRFAQTNSMLAAIAPRYESVLELGCGEGHHSVHLRALADRLYGVDLSQKAVERARRRCPDAEFAVGELETAHRLFAETQFDLITACEVLYYVRDSGAILAGLQARTRRIFVSNYLPRSERIRTHFTGERWRKLDCITHEQTVWECFLWESPELGGR